MTLKEAEEVRQIVAGFMHLISNGKISGQFGKDLEKLCAFAFVYLPEDKPVTLPQGCVVESLPIKETINAEAFDELRKALEIRHAEFLDWWKEKHPGLRKDRNL